ncbi:MAG TPA: sigma-70 family RNA polymerase sigma factor, partial [Gemmataceae bacterium]|nr:sigma-70 family RNA polymerase sigma factor [Gemmataceae bacterium]
MSTGQLHPVIRYIRKLAGAGPAGEATDAQLLARFIKDRDESAFTMIVERHGPMVLNICRRMLNDAHEVDDVFQAVFLVLVRKAGSVGKPELLANWLYGVACRTAAKARGQAYRRQAHVKEMVDMPATDTTSDHAWQELRPVLDEELKTLPDKYRAPLVLCYLQGKTYTEAARILGWAEGTVSGRLARGRELLRAKLTRRGLTLSAATLATLLTHNAASAMLVPAALATNTIKAALLVAAGNTLAAGVISTPVATLTEGVLHAMFLTKLKIAAAVILAMGVLGMGGGAFTYNAWAVGKEQDKKEAEKSKEKGAFKNDLAVKAPAAEEKEPVGIKQDSGKRTAKMRDILATEIKFEGATDPKQTLGEFLEELSDRYNLTFDVNENAFKYAQLTDVMSTPIADKPLLKMNDIRLSTLLRKVLTRIPTATPGAEATFMIRGDHIEITTIDFLRHELGLDFPRVIGQGDDNDSQLPALLPLVVV